LESDMLIKSSLQTSTQLSKIRLNWILAGRLDSITPTVSKVHSFHASVLMRNYTNISIVPGKWMTSLRNRTMEENICERHFLDNVSQNSQGRYTVKLPVREQMLNNIGVRQLSSDCLSSEGHRETFQAQSYA